MVAWQLSGTDWVDDWNYKLMPESHDGFWHMKGEKITDFNQAAEAIGRHHCYTTPRLPNYLQTFANLLPAWPVRTLHGLMLAATFLILALSCGGRRIMQSAGFVAVLWLAAWVILPINNLMISSDFAFNYFWTSPLIMIFVYLLTSGKLRSGRWSFIPWATAAIVGTMHEGATFPVAAGCVALIAVNKTDRLRRAALLSVMAGVAIAFFFNSGMMERIGQHVTERDNTFLKYMTINLFIESYGLYLAIASVVIASIKGGRHGTRFFVTDNIVWLTSVVGAMAIALSTMLRGRALWFVDLFGLILFFKAIYQYLKWWQAPRDGIAIIAGAALLTTITASATIQHRLSAESDEIARRLSEGSEPVVFIDFMSPDKIPWWTMKVPQSVTDKYPNSSLMMYHNDKAPYILMLPVDMSEEKPEEWPKATGNTGLSGRYPFLAGRKRLANPEAVILTFRSDIPIGERIAAQGPVNALANLARNGGRSYSTVYPVEEWAIKYMEDTLWCYSIGQLRRLDMNVGIISIDTIR